MAHKSAPNSHPRATLVFSFRADKCTDCFARLWLASWRVLNGYRQKGFGDCVWRQYRASHLYNSISITDVNDPGLGASNLYPTVLATAYGLANGPRGPPGVTEFRTLTSFLLERHGGCSVHKLRNIL